MITTMTTITTALSMVAHINNTSNTQACHLRKAMQVRWFTTSKKQFLPVGVPSDPEGPDRIFTLTHTSNRILVYIIAIAWGL